ncbi:MAG: ferrous iron transport protein A [Desulfobulbaceae bacterium]|nr:MAG: ferrous iron transport protein A [Desulfobulbaceae bacterium]
MVKKLLGYRRNGKKRRAMGLCQSSKSCKASPLSQCEDRGGRMKVCKVSGDRKKCARMAELGLYPGNEIELVCTPEKEGCLLKVHGGTVSIDRETMDCIMVSE